MRPLSLFLIVTLLAGCASSKEVQRPAPAGVSSWLLEEKQIGEKIHAEILSSFYVYSEPRLVNYVNQIGNSIAGHARRKELNYRFTILYNDKIYAASAPGGHIYVTTALICFLDNESELAAVLAHEVGQLQYQDPRVSPSRKALEALTRGGAAVGPAFGSIGALAAMGLVLLHAAAEAGDMSVEERLIQADADALHYLVEAGEDPQGLIDFFYKFLNADQVLTPYFYDYYQSRPISEPRIQAVLKEFSSLPLSDKTFSTHRETFQEATKGIREIYKT